MTLEEVRQLRVNGEPVPTLEEEISTAEAIEAIHDKGKKVMVWTVKESDSIEHFLLSSADTIITDQVKESLKIKAELQNRTVAQRMIDDVRSIFGFD